jgi:hypothetical protein
MNHSRMRAVATDIQFWIPIVVLAFGIFVLVVIQ